MHNFKALKQPRISEEVLRQLKEAILLGRYQSGEKLPSERELTEAFQVSRGVIREAIRVLEITGFVVTRQGPTGGAFVTELSFDHLGNAFLDLFLANRLAIPEMTHVRLLIEPEVARLAAQNANVAVAEKLKRAQQAEFNPADNNSALVTKMQDVHLILAENCGNHILEAISKSMLKLTREIVEAVEPDHKALHAAGEHQTVVEAVIGGDSAAAAKAMRTHVQQFGERLIRMENIYREKVKWPVNQQVTA